MLDVNKMDEKEDGDTGGTQGARGVPVASVRHVLRNGFLAQQALFLREGHNGGRFSASNVILYTHGIERTP